MGARSEPRSFETDRFRASVFSILAAILLAAVPSAVSAEDSDVEVTLGKGGLQAKTADGQFKIKIGGRLHADGTFHIGDQPPNIPGPGGWNDTATDGTEIRRGRLLVKATVFEDFSWVGEVDFADNETELKDFLVSYSGFDHGKITVGHQKQPYSLALEMSSNDLPFTERSADIDLVSTLLDRAIGARYDVRGNNWFFAAGFYGDGVEPQKDDEQKKDNQVEGWGAAAKLVVTPVREEGSVIHLGFRGAFRRPEEDNETVEFKTETTHMSNYNPVKTGDLQDVDGIVLFGPEFAVAHGPFSVFAEYTRAIVLRHPGNRLNFDGFHVGATVSLTGESRAASYSIKSGEFKRLKPAQNFSLKNGGWGAWELAGRYAYLSANRGIPDTDGVTELPGGVEQSFTIALNWYLNHNVRVIWNYRHIIETDEGRVDPAGVVNREAAGLNAFTTRVQFTF